MAVIGGARDHYDVTFHFYQVDRKARRLYSRMECSNAASASEVIAKLLGIIPTGHAGSFRTINLATHQQIELMAPDSDRWCGDWGVRFIKLRHLWAHMTEAREPFSFEHGDLTVRGDIVQHGNVFVMASLPIDTVDAGLVSKLAALGDAYAARMGHPASPSKIMIYRVTSVTGTGRECDATCFSEGQQHHSLPGSAAMAMGAFLTTTGLLSLSEDADGADTDFRFNHPSGSMRAQAHLRRGHKHWEIASTSFETPIRLLMHGELVVY